MQIYKINPKKRVFVLIFITRLNLFAKIKCVLVVDMDFVT